MLDPFNRGAIVALMALCVVGTVELTPLPARSFFDTTGPRMPRTGVAPAAKAIAIVPVRRDPFAEPPPPNAPALAAAAPSAPVPRGTIGILPSNLIGETIPTLPGAPPEADAPQGPGAARITAIVTGAHPFAMVESGGNHEIKGIGDRVGGIPIISIDIDGIRLQNGGHLGVDPAARP